MACTSVPRLTQVYQSVINAYHLTTIGLDIEEAALDSFPRGAVPPSSRHRSGRPGPGSASWIWLTLPSERDGLQDNVRFHRDVARARVAITGVNVIAIPAWSLKRVYTAGDKVVFQGEPYQVKWSNQGSCRLPRPATPRFALAPPLSHPRRANG